LEDIEIVTPSSRSMILRPSTGPNNRVASLTRAASQTTALPACERFASLRTLYPPDDRFACIEGHAVDLTVTLPVDILLVLQPLHWSDQSSVAAG